MSDIEKYAWSKWRPLPNPLNKDYLTAPIGFGVYQIRRKGGKDYILFGRGGSISNRIASLFPELPGVQNRNNDEKIEYVHNHIDELEYRTLACNNEDEAIDIERKIRQNQKHLFHT